MLLPLCLSLTLSAFLAGCSTVSTVRDAWDWDPTARLAVTGVRVPPEQLSAMTNRVAELQMERQAIRARIGAEPDIRVRQRLYEDLHHVGRQLSPLERELTAAAPAR